MKKLSKLDTALLPLIIIATIILIGAFGVLFYVIWFLMPIHWIFKLLISICVIYCLYLGNVMADIRAEKQIAFFDEQLKKLKEEKEKGE